MRVLLLSAAFLFGLILMGISAASNAQQLAARVIEDPPSDSETYQGDLDHAIPRNVQG